jgi:SAM-dependent methyltransferase
MEKDEYRKHFELEESFWWFRGRRKILLSLLRSHRMPDLPLVWLDAGCGTGFNMTFFAPFGPVFGCDFSEEALAFCRKRGLKNLARADVQRLPYKNEAFDAASLLDVLYHKNIFDDVAALKDVHRTLKPGGLLLVADSAFNVLRSRHDLAVHGRERYRKKALKQKLEKAGYQVLRLSYLNFFLFPFIFLVRFTERIRRPKPDAIQSDLKAVPPLANGFLFGILKFEAFLSKRINLPWGSSLICLARKKP